MLNERRFSKCPESVSGHDVGGTIDGTCAWCRAQVDTPRARPRLPLGHRTELETAYGRHYDPDYDEL